MVTVRPGNAVVMTMGASISRICGPSSFLSKNFEFVSRVLPLTKRRRSLVIVNILTSDQLLVDVHLSFVYGIIVSDDTIVGKNAKEELADGSKGLTDTERQQLQQMANLAQDWEQDVQSIVSAAVHNVVGGYRYDKILRLNDNQGLALKVIKRARTKILLLGAELQSVAVAKVTPPAEVIDALAEGESIRTRHGAEGDGFERAITAVANGYSVALGIGMTLDDIHREAARYMMEHMAHDPATKVLLPPLQQIAGSTEKS
jgi:regulator of protease activity HflC (stomatin/prohibitin superfamily)